MSDAKYIDSIDTLLPSESSPLSGARIGCTLCIAACPVDAIVGAAKLMHTVIAQHCIGCELCLPPCPVDCIAIVASAREWTPSDATMARERFAGRKARLASRPAHHPRPAPAVSIGPEKKRRRAAVAAA